MSWVARKLLDRAGRLREVRQRERGGMRRRKAKRSMRVGRMRVRMEDTPTPRGVEP